MAVAVGLLFLSACGKRCKEWVRLPYPEQLHAYMKAYKPGSWWVYENTMGQRDSVYLTEYRETMEAVREGDRPCFGMPTTEFALRTTGMDTTGKVYVTYRLGLKGRSVETRMRVNGFHGPELMTFVHNADQGYYAALVVDTSMASSSYTDALLVRRHQGLVGRDLDAILLAKGIGIVGYTTLTDTFTLTTYHIP